MLFVVCVCYFLATDDIDDDDGSDGGMGGPLQHRSQYSKSSNYRSLRQHSKNGNESSVSPRGFNVNAMKARGLSRTDTVIEHSHDSSREPSVDPVGVPSGDHGYNSSNHHSNFLKKPRKPVMCRVLFFTTFFFLFLSLFFLFFDLFLFCVL